MRVFSNRLQRLLQEDAGGTMVEYALLAALIGMALFGVLSDMGASLDGVFVHVSDMMADHTPSGGS